MEGEQEKTKGLLTLDRRGCLNLKKILSAFSAPITEEHAWALIHQTLVCLTTVFNKPWQVLYGVEGTKDILITKDGDIHELTFCSKGKPGQQRGFLKSEGEAVADIGMAVYEALDYSLSHDQQRTLSNGLEQLIDRMTTALEQHQGDGEDEGIGGEEEEDRQTVAIIRLCKDHLATRTEAPSHYRAVCRALVAEAIEISSFMERTRDMEGDQDLQDLNRKDWTNLWGQMMHQLRQGIKLRKVDFTKSPEEFTLTPYEMLMDDIRLKRFRLTPVELEPKVKTEAKDLILDFIRSRPPLKPAAQRVLKPRRRRESTAKELLLEDIREGQARKSLRKVSLPVIPSVPENIAKGYRARRKGAISPPDNHQMLRQNSDKSLDRKIKQGKQKKHSAARKLSKQNSEKRLGGLQEERKESQQNNSGDHIDIGSAERKVSRQNSKRSVDVLPSSTKSFKQKSENNGDNEERQDEDINQKNKTKKHVQFSHPQPLSQVGTKKSPSTHKNKKKLQITIPEGIEEATPPQNYLRAPPTPSKYKMWTRSLDSLHLNLAEVCHIRTQLSLAELEDRDLGEKTMDDMKEGRTCFICVSVTFGLLNWAYLCQICTKYVCAKCCGKLKLPPEKPMVEVTVAQLIPQLCLPTPTPAQVPGPTEILPSSPSNFLRASLGRLSFRSQRPKPSVPTTPDIQGPVPTLRRAVLERSKTMSFIDAKKVAQKVLFENDNQSQDEKTFVTPGRKLTQIQAPALTSPPKPKLIRSKTSISFANQDQGMSGRTGVCQECEESLREVVRVMKDGESEEHERLLT